MDDHVFDHHTLYVKIDNLPYCDVFRIMGFYVSQACNITKSHCEYTVNIPTGKNGKTYGYAYCWVTSEQVHNVLCGRNADGTTRDSPLVTAVIAGCKDTAVICASPSSDCKDTSDIGQLLVTTNPSFASQVDEEHKSNVIVSSRLPAWLSKEILSDYFSPFAVTNSDVYPKVSIFGSNNNRCARVTFDPKSHDAYFALQMNKRAMIKVKIDDTIAQHCLFFEHERK